jgi:hypothetical protein
VHGRHAGLLLPLALLHLPPLLVDVGEGRRAAAAAEQPLQVAHSRLVPLLVLSEALPLQLAHVEHLVRVEGRVRVRVRRRLG